jgi:hypothetical protein
MNTKVPRFILSYVRTERDRYLDRFFANLRNEVALREGLEDKPENLEPGFRDTDSMPGGSNWREDLAQALAESWACVCVYTPRYFQRESCGKEFQVFLERASVQYDPDGSVRGAKGILPVLWVSMDDLKRNGLPPKIASGISFRATKYHDRYEKEGLRYILQRSPTSAYIDILRDIVDDLIRLFADRPKPLPSVPKYDEIKNAFPGGEEKTTAMKDPPAGPQNLHVLIVHEHSKTDPLSDPSSGLKEVLLELEPKLRVDVQLLDTGTEAAQSILTQVIKSSTRNALVVVVALQSTSPPMPDKAWLDKLLESNQWTGAVLLVARQAGSPSDIKIPAENRDRISARISEGDPKSVRQAFCDIILEVTSRIVGNSEVQQHAPGGGKSAEKPIIRGPIKEEGS